MKRILFLFLVFVFSNTNAQQYRAKIQGFVDLKVENKEVRLYNESYALIIGNSDYDIFDDLPGVKEDVIAVKDALVNNGFNVTIAENLTKDGMDKAFTNFIAKYGKDKENRLLFYYAGHGHTVKSSYGESIGYLVPLSAKNPSVDEIGFQATALPMSRIEEYAKLISSKHAMFLFDACFSGSIFATSRAVPSVINYNTSQAVRQFITSGTENESVPDKSIFRAEFVTALTSSYADANKDGYLTGSELGKFLQDNVVNYSKNNQHPQYGKIRNKYLDKGDFVFELSNKKQTENVVPEVGGLVQGEVVYTYGDIIIDSEFAGKVFLDNKPMGNINANSKGNKLAKQLTGKHSLKIVGNDESFSKEVVVIENKVVTIVAKSTKKTQIPTEASSVSTADLPQNMSLIRAGSFTMGSSENEPDRRANETQHKVTLTYDFFMGNYEVSQQEYESLMGKNPSYFKGANLPVEKVSWFDAIKYCNALSEKEGLPIAYSQNIGDLLDSKGNKTTDITKVVGYRLPTEAEWEYAARAGTSTAFNLGNNLTTKQVNYNAYGKGEYRRKTVAINSFSPNAYGLYNMHGNVYEWCNDWYGTYNLDISENPIGNIAGSGCVLRGGSWYNHAKFCRSACRISYMPDYQDNFIGFRLCRTVD